jgi:hypothetical protein
VAQQLIDSKQRRKYEETQQVMAREKNFQNFRAHLHQVDPPCIPYLGVYLTDLTFIEDGNKDFVKVLASLWVPRGRALGHNRLLTCTVHLWSRLAVRRD